LLELEITEGGFGPIFTNEQQAKLRAQIDEFRTLTAKETPLKTEEKKLLR
jgi:hypothetical protein